MSRQQFTLLMSFLGLTSTRLGSEVSCPRTLPRKKKKKTRGSGAAGTQDPGLRVKHFTTEPRGTRTRWVYDKWEKLLGLMRYDDPSCIFKAPLQHITAHKRVGKVEIARYENEQFLLFPQCFQQTCTADTKNTRPVWKRVNM